MDNLCIQGDGGGGSGLKRIHVGRNLKYPNSYSNLIMWEITTVHNLGTNQYPSRGGWGGGVPGLRKESTSSISNCW